LAIRFHDSPHFSTPLVVWALEEIGVTYERIPRAKDDAELTLDDGDVKFVEATAILLHLGETYGVRRGLFPEHGTPECGQALSWIVWAQSEGFPPVLQHMRNGADAAARAEWERVVSVVDRWLATRPYLAGQSFTFADLAVAMLMSIATQRAGLRLDAADNVKPWLARCVARPALRRIVVHA